MPAPPGTIDLAGKAVKVRCDRTPQPPSAAAVWPAGAMLWLIRAAARRRHDRPPKPEGTWISARMSTCSFERREHGVLLITMNRPEVYNAADEAMHSQLARGLGRRRAR